jgi:MoaA/NifB/PqqE/SkfB family radical SAM enzyme
MESISPPDTVYLHLTRKCNLRCVYCFLSAGESMENELTTSELAAVLNDIHTLNPRRVVFTGGEPLLREDVSNLARTFKSAGDEIHLCIITNGTLVNEENAKDLVRDFDETRISIDGPEEINDATRGRGTFKKSMKAFEYVLKAGGNPKASITITSANLPHLKEFISYLIRNGIARIHLSPLKAAGRAKNGGLHCGFEEAQRIVEEFWHETFGRQLKRRKKETFNCGVGRSLAVYPDGSAYPCHVLAFPEFCIGNVRREDLHSIYHHSKIMNRLRSLDLCEIAPRTEFSEELSREETCLGVRAQNQHFRECLREVIALPRSKI